MRIVRYLGGSNEIIGEKNRVGIGVHSMLLSLKPYGFWPMMTCCRGAISIMDFPANGRTFAIATLGPISF